MGFERKEGKIAIKPVHRRETPQKSRTVEQLPPVEAEKTLEEFFEYKTGSNQVLKDMFKSLAMNLSKEDFQTFCDNTLEKEALFEDFERRKVSWGNPIQYGFITYAMEILREVNAKTFPH